MPSRSSRAAGPSAPSSSPRASAIASIVERRRTSGVVRRRYADGASRVMNAQGTSLSPAARRRIRWACLQVPSGTINVTGREPPQKAASGRASGWGNNTTGSPCSAQAGTACDWSGAPRMTAPLLGRHRSARRPVLLGFCVSAWWSTTRTRVRVTTQGIRSQRQAVTSRRHPGQRCATRPSTIRFSGLRISAGGSFPEALPDDGRLEAHVAAGHVESPLGVSQRPARVSVGGRVERVEKSAVERVDLDALGLVNRLRPRPLLQRRNVTVGEHHQAGRGLARLVEALRRRHPHLQPQAETALQVPRPDRGLVGAGQAFRESNPRLVTEAIPDHARQQVPHRLGRMPRHPQVERLVDAAVDVRQLNLKVIDRRRLRHWRGHYYDWTAGSKRTPKPIRRVLVQDLRGMSRVWGMRIKLPLVVGALLAFVGCGGSSSGGSAGSGGSGGSAGAGAKGGTGGTGGQKNTGGAAAGAAGHDAGAADGGGLTTFAVG